MSSTHGILEDIGAELGYTATRALVDWFGGQSLYIPTTATPGHQIEVVIGRQAFVRLVSFADDLFGQYGRVLSLPIDHQRETGRRNKMIAVALERGDDVAVVAREHMLTTRQVANIRKRFEADGLLPLIREIAKREAAGDE